MFDINSIKLPRVKEIFILFFQQKYDEVDKILILNEEEKNKAKHKYSEILKINVELEKSLFFEKEKNLNSDEIMQNIKSGYEEKIENIITKYNTKLPVEKWYA
jgi:hypothetical protein